MNDLAADLRGGLAIVRASWVAVAVFVVFGACVDMATHALAHSLGQQIPVEWPAFPTYAASMALAWLPSLVVSMVLVLFMIEIAAAGADRCAGKDVRMQLDFKPRVAWAVVASICLSGMLAYVLLVVLNRIEGFLGGFMMNSPGIAGTPGIDTEDPVWFSAVMNFFYLAIVAFSVARFALIPFLARHYGMGFRQAWTPQPEPVNGFIGAFRRRFFYIFLMILIVDAVLIELVGHMAASVAGKGIAYVFVELPLSILLVTVLPVSVLTHMVRSINPLITRTLGRETDYDTGK